jgi:NADH:ubiquinone oxidoreductase subunit F (NADH-binding)
MKQIIKDAIDWTSVKLNVIASIGFLTQDSLIRNLTIFATLTTIIYNGFRIFNEIKKLKNK